MTDKAGSQTIVAILGHPFAGKRTLAKGIEGTRSGIAVVDSSSIRRGIAAARSAAFVEARDLAASGRVPPDALIGQLLAEALLEQRSHALLVGYPRGDGQASSLRSLVGHDFFVVHLRASEELLDQRRAAAGLPPIETTNPGALTRITVATEPLISRAATDGMLLELDARRPPAELVAAVTTWRQELGVSPAG